MMVFGHVLQYCMLKKKIFSVVAAVAVVAAAGWSYQQSKQSVELSDLAMENVEALATGEANVGDPCYKGSYNSSLPEAVKCAHPCTKERCGGETDKCY